MAAPIRVEQVLSFGAEEEFVVADVTDRVAVPRAPEVLEKMARRDDRTDPHGPPVSGPVPIWPVLTPG